MVDDETALGGAAQRTCNSTNLQLYDEDPGPRETSVASRDAPRVGDRPEALVQLLRRQVLTSFGGRQTAHPRPPSRVSITDESATSSKPSTTAWKSAVPLPGLPKITGT